MPAPMRVGVPATEGDVRAAYRILLDREGDTAEMSHYLSLARAGGLSIPQMRHDFLHSPEFRYRQAAALATVDMGGIHVVVDPFEPEFGHVIARHKVWEPHIIRQIVDHLEPGATYVDIGANVGVMSFHAARAVGPTGKVIAFEPNQDNVDNLLRGICVNQFKNVTVLPFAASSSHSIFALHGSSNTHLVEPDGIDALTQAFRVDHFLANEERVDFVKLDIEGHEPHALAGMTETLQRHRPIVLCEFNPRCLRDHIGQDTREFAASLFDLTGCVKIVEHDGGLTKINSADDLMDLWASRNKEITQAGLLPEGMLHFDLLFQVR